MRLTRDAWYAIASGCKDIEMRLCDEKRAQLKIDDIIEFTDVQSGEVLRARVKALHRFQSFFELYAAFPKERLGYSFDEEAHPADMERYYSQCDIRKFGVLGIEVEVVK